MSLLNAITCATLSQNPISARKEITMQLYQHRKELRYTINEVAANIIAEQSKDNPNQSYIKNQKEFLQSLKDQHFIQFGEYYNGL